MSEKGWEVEIIDGATSADVPDAQMDSYLQAVSECSEALGFTTPRELTEEELATAFESQLANRSCLVALGFDLPEGPSLQSYVDEQGYWTPYADLPEVSDAVLAELERECPQYQLW